MFWAFFRAMAASWVAMMAKIADEERAASSDGTAVEGSDASHVLFHVLARHRHDSFFVETASFDPRAQVNELFKVVSWLTAEQRAQIVGLWAGVGLTVSDVSMHVGHAPPPFCRCEKERTEDACIFVVSDAARKRYDVTLALETREDWWRRKYPSTSPSMDDVAWALVGIDFAGIGIDPDAAFWATRTGACVATTLDAASMATRPAAADVMHAIQNTRHWVVEDAAWVGPLTLQARLCVSHALQLCRHVGRTATGKRHRTLCVDKSYWRPWSAAEVKKELCEWTREGLLGMRWPAKGPTLLPRTVTVAEVSTQGNVSDPSFAVDDSTAIATGTIGTTTATTTTDATDDATDATSS